MPDREDYVSSDIDPDDFQQLITHFVAKMGFEVESLKRTREGTIDVVAKSANPLGGSVLSLIRAQSTPETIRETDIQKLYDDMRKMDAVRAAYITTSEFSDESQQYSQGKPISLVNKYRLFESISMSGVEVEDEFAELLDKYGLAERYYQKEKHAYAIGMSQSEAEESFEERAKSLKHPYLKPKDRVIRVSGRYSPVGVFHVTDIAAERIHRAEKEGVVLHDEEWVSIDLYTGELYYIEKGQPPKKGFMSRSSGPPQNKLRRSTIIEDILLLPPESKAHLIDLLEHGDLPHEHLTGKHLSILEKRGVVHVYNLADKRSTSTAEDIVGFFVSIMLMFIDEILDFFGNMGESSTPAQKEEPTGEKKLGVGARVKMPHDKGGLYNLREYLVVEEGLAEDFEVDQTRYRSKDIERILKSILGGDVTHKGVIYMPYYEGKYLNKEQMRVIKREALYAPEIKQLPPGEPAEGEPKRRQSYHPPSRGTLVTEGGTRRSSIIE